jgi:hypothetical protein
VLLVLKYVDETLTTYALSDKVRFDSQKYIKEHKNHHPNGCWLLSPHCLPVAGIKRPSDTAIGVCITDVVALLAHVCITCITTTSNNSSAT